MAHPPTDAGPPAGDAVSTLADPAVPLEPRRRFVPPMVVHLCWHLAPGASPACARVARHLYEFLHRPIGDDPVQRPGLEIPVQYGRDLAGLVAALDADAEPAADARVVVAILDAAAYASPSARAAVRSAVRRWTGPDGAARHQRGEAFLPLVLDPRWNAELSTARRSAHAGISLPGGVGTGEERWQVGADVAVVVARTLLRAQRQAATLKPRVFISHTKADGADLARHLAEHFKTRTRIEAWFDETDLTRGDELVTQLEEAAGHGVLIIVRTDQYSESPWCALELLAAKRAQIPMVTVLANDDGEAVTSPYGGNHRTLGWRPGREWSVVGRCVQEWLRGHHFRAHAVAALAAAGLPSDSWIVPRRPELFDLVSSETTRRRIVVHPDPPLSEDEAAVLRASKPSVRLVTPSTMLGRVLLANDPRPPLAGCELAFSLSEAEELPELTAHPNGSGLTQAHLDDVIFTIALTTLNTGARIAYGGDFRRGRSYALQLSDLHRARRRLGIGVHSQLICFVDDRGERAGDARVEYQPEQIPDPPLSAGHADAVRETLWRMAMRREMSRRCTGRILAGGQAQAAATDGGPGYAGPWPGLLEEAFTTLAAGKALYVVGGFGGLAGALAAMLTADAVPPAFTAAASPGARLARVTAEVDLARRELLAGGFDRESLLADESGALAGVEDLARAVLDRWRAFAAGDATAWVNGLDLEENQRLFRSTDRTDIAHLVFQGLRKLERRGDPATTMPDIELSLYHGDLTTIRDIDAYAVTTTPGVPNVGAMAALDDAMSGRLSRAAATDDGRGSRVVPHGPRLCSLPVETDALAGYRAFVGEIELPTAGAIDANAVHDLARDIAAAANRLGIDSIAATPFASTMGLAPLASVGAILAGLRAGRRGGTPGKLIVCETDRRKYEALRAGLERDGQPFAELRSGEIPVGRPAPLVLHAEANVDAAGAATVTTTMYPPDGDDAVVPRYQAALSPTDWVRLRTRPPTFPASIALGEAMWTRILSAPMRVLIERLSDRRVLIVANALASSLPWEFLASDTGSPVSTRIGMVRRLARSGDYQLAAGRASTDARLRVLLVVDPTEDLPGSRKEGEAVAKLLSGRADVYVKVLLGSAASRDAVLAELRNGHHDVLHYAGHAYFDEATLDSGLVLAGRERLTGAMLAVREDGEDHRPPRLIVLGACASARLRDDPASRPDVPSPPAPRASEHAFAEELLVRGVAALVGTFYKVGDNAALGFASAFHAALVAGESVGEATRRGRATLRDGHHQDWANFVLYGDDTLTL